MKLKQCLPILLVILIFTNCNKSNDFPEKEFPLETASEIDNEEYKVYSTFFNDWNSHKIIIKQATSNSISIHQGNSFYEYLKDQISEVDTTTITDFIEKNETIYYLDNLFSVSPKKVTLVSENEITDIFNTQDLNAGWKNLKLRYPDSNGFVQVTRVGLNSEKNQAVFEIGHFYASLGAEGRIIFLKKINSKWQVVQTFSTWIS